MGKIPAGKRGSRGWSGTYITWGQLSNAEFNTELRGRAWIDTVHKMLTDSIVKSARDARRQSLLSATWTLDSASKNSSALSDPEKAKADEIRDFVAGALGLDGSPGQMSIPFEEALASFVNYEDNGYRYLEEIWKIGEDGRVYLDRWADRMPSAHGEWSRKKGLFDGVRQLGDENGAFVSGSLLGPKIPADKLLLLVRDQEGDNWEGVGTLRSCHYEWRLSVHALSMLGVALEKWALSTPKVSINREELFNDLRAAQSEQTVDEAIDEAISSLRKYLAQEDGVVVEYKGAEISTYGEGQLNLAGFQAIEDIITRRIQYSYLVQFLSLGQGSTGARSVGETQIDFFHDGAANSLDYIGGRIGGPDRPGAGTIGRLVKYNFGDVSPALLPKLAHAGLKTTALAQSFGDLGTLLQNNALQDTDELESAILDTLGAGPITDASRELRAARHNLYINDPRNTIGPGTEPLPEG